MGEEGLGTRLELTALLLYTGIGKTHYIRQQLKSCEEVLTIAINEVFSPVQVIKKLRSLSWCKRNIGLFFNFTIVPPGVSCCYFSILLY